MTLKIETLSIDGFEKVIHGVDGDFNCFIAIHSTTLGPALGGLRIINYDSDDHALKDVLLLAEGMTLKNSLAGLDMGGGKAVLNTKQKTPELLRQYGEMLNELNGTYVTAEAGVS